MDIVKVLYLSKRRVIATSYVSPMCPSLVKVNGSVNYILATGYKSRLEFRVWGNVNSIYFGLQKPLLNPFLSLTSWLDYSACFACEKDCPRDAAVIGLITISYKATINP